jgi:hypothetical protein
MISITYFQLSISPPYFLLDSDRHITYLTPPFPIKYIIVKLTARVALRILQTNSVFRL